MLWVTGGIAATGIILALAFLPHSGASVTSTASDAAEPEESEDDELAA